MTLREKLESLTNRLADEFNAIRTEMSSLSGGSTSGNIDGGIADTNFGGTTSIDGGGP